MSSEIYARIRENPKFKELVSKRERLAWTLTGIVLVLFFGLFPGLTAMIAFYSWAMTWEPGEHNGAVL